MAIQPPDVTSPMTDNETWNTCIYCNESWKDIVPTPGLLHRTIMCVKCKNNPRRRYPHYKNETKKEK